MINSATPNDSSATNALLDRMRQGDRQALADLFARHRQRLRRMVRLRLDRRLLGRIDPSDVLKAAYLDISTRAEDYIANPTSPVFLWLRSLTGQKLMGMHRQYLGGQIRDAGEEVSLYRGSLPQATSASLAAQLLGNVTSPAQAAARAEMQIRLQEALNAMEALDREVLVLRHFEELSNSETAEVLGIEQSAASIRYIRALKRLKDVLSAMPGFFASRK